MSRELIVKCDRCGRRDFQCQTFKIEFNKKYLPNRSISLRDLETGDLCPECAHAWSERYFNEIGEWIKTKVNGD